MSAIDIGLNNLAVLTHNNGQPPLIIPGGPLKSINQFYNKKKGQLQSKLETNKHCSNNLSRLTHKRTNKISDYLHKASHYIINYLVSQNITTLVIGKNDQWKQRINLGKKNNQNFVQIPFAKFIQMLEYKAKLVGVKVMLQEESYTSKCSFLDQESIEKHDQYLGSRIKRGLFRASDAKILNADANASANIMRKAIPNIEYIEGIEAVVVQPIRITPNKNKIWSI